MNDNKILIIAAVGIGAFLLTRNAQAGTNAIPYAKQKNLPVNASGQTTGGYFPGQTTDPTAQKINAVVNLATMVKNFFTGGSSLPTSEAGDGASSAGELAAQNYYINNQDAFAVNPPTLYQQDSGWTGSGFDNQ